MTPHRGMGLLIDYGGVLTVPLAPVFSAYCRSEGLPDDATVEDAMERLYFLAKIERGLEQSEAETISHEEIKAKFLK